MNDTSMRRQWAQRTPAAAAAWGAALLAALAACSKGGSTLAQVVDSAVVGTAQAASPAAPVNALWKERGPSEPLPQGVVPMPSLAPLVKTLKPGVINIYTTSVTHLRTRRGQGGDPFEEFFRRFHEGMPEESKRQSLGSGMILEPQRLPAHEQPRGRRRHGDPHQAR